MNLLTNSMLNSMILLILLTTRKIRVDLHESKPKALNPSKGETHDKPTWICHFCEKSGHIHPNCYKLHAAKQANIPKVPMPQAQDPMVLIGELVKTLNLYSNPEIVIILM